MREIITTCVSYLGHMCAPSYPGNEQLSSLDFKKTCGYPKNVHGQRKVVVAEEYLFVEIHSLESSGAIRTRCPELVVNGYDPRSVSNQ